jgi:hypothetical protein
LVFNVVIGAPAGRICIVDTPNVLVEGDVPIKFERHNTIENPGLIGGLGRSCELVPGIRRVGQLLLLKNLKDRFIEFGAEKVVRRIDKCGESLDSVLDRPAHLNQCCSQRGRHGGRYLDAQATNITIQFVLYGRQYGVHRMVRQLKGRSSRLLRAEFSSLATRLPTLWTNVCGFGVSATTGGWGCAELAPSSLILVIGRVFKTFNKK